MKTANILSTALLAAATFVGQVSAQFRTVRTQKDGAVLTIILDNQSSEINLWSQLMSVEVDQIINSLRNDTSTKAVIFQSGNPKFFIAHYDVLTREGQPNPNAPGATEFNTRLFYNISSLAQTTIAMIEGPARGIGAEFLGSVDMRFATNNAVVGNFEVTFGEHPGTGGAAWMASLVSRGNAMEFLLSGDDFDASTLQSWGYITKTFESSKSLKSYVSKLAKRIALFPLNGVASIKTTVNALTRPSWEQFAFESAEWNRLLASPLLQQLLGNLLVLTKNQTDVKFEYNLGKNVLQIYNTTP